MAIFFLQMSRLTAPSASRARSSVSSSSRSTRRALLHPRPVPAGKAKFTACRSTGDRAAGGTIPSLRLTLPLRAIEESHGPTLAIFALFDRTHVQGIVFGLEKRVFQR